MRIKKHNRAHKRFCKQGCGCKMCKPHKGKYALKFAKKFINKMEDMDSEFSEIVDKNFWDLL